VVINKYLAELLGTFILVVLGSMGILAVAARNPEGVAAAADMVAIGLAFGLALLAAIWAVGHVSGGHFNPAVTLAMLMDRRVSFGDAIGYWIGQFAGAGVASLVVWAAAGSREAVGLTATTYDDLNTAILVEVLLTAVFVWTILTVSRRGANHAPTVIAFTLVAAHLAGIPFSGASLNPARSFGPAAVAANFDPLWVYIYAPLIGAVIAFALFRLFPPETADTDT
jgi:aquaporin Z